MSFDGNYPDSGQEINTHLGGGQIWFPRGIFDDPFFKDEPVTFRGAFLWLACKGRIVRVTVGDLAREWGVHDRKAVQMVRRMERNGLVTVSGSGRCRLICIASGLVRTCGFYVSKEARFPNGRGAGKWRGPAMSKKLRESVLKRDGHTCQYCGQSNVPMHVDHIKPVALGGKDKLENLTAACAPCNLSKGSKTLKQWRPRND